MEKFIEFQPYTVNLSSVIVFELFINFSVIFGSAKMRQPLKNSLISYSYSEEEYSDRHYENDHLQLPGPLDPASVRHVYHRKTDEKHGICRKYNVCEAVRHTVGENYDSGGETERYRDRQ